MAAVYFDEQDTDETRRRMTTPGYQAPAESAPASLELPRFTAPGTPIAPLSGQQMGLNSDAAPLWTKHDDQGFYYDWRSAPYQSPLSDREIAAERGEETYRQAHTSEKLPEDSASLQSIMRAPQAPALNAITASQQGTRAPAPQASRSTFATAAPPLQFDDPYTKRLEQLVNQQLSSLEQPQANPAMESFLNFLNQQFTNLSTAPGYSPEELALIRTQMLEPIERDRHANRERVLQRTAMRGMLPSSGLHEQDLQEFVDRPAMDARTAAQRDVALNAINRRRQDLQQAAQLGRTAAIDVPGLMREEDRQRRGEALNLASLAYDLPNRALQENLSVINGTPGPESLFNQAIALQQQQNQQRALNQQKWAQIGTMLAGLFT